MRLTVPPHPKDYILSAVSALLLITITLFLIIAWREIPQEAILHYDIYGHVDVRGPKSFLILEAAFGWVIFFALTGIGLFPRIWSTGISVPDRTRMKVYRSIKHMLLVIKLCLCFCFFYEILAGATGHEVGWWFSPAYTAVIVTSATVCLIRCVRLLRAWDFKTPARD